MAITSWSPEIEREMEEVVKPEYGMRPLRYLSKKCGKSVWAKDHIQLAYNGILDKSGHPSSENYHEIVSNVAEEV